MLLLVTLMTTTPDAPIEFGITGAQQCIAVDQIHCTFCCLHRKPMGQVAPRSTHDRLTCQDKSESKQKISIVELRMIRPGANLLQMGGVATAAVLLSHLAARRSEQLIASKAACASASFSALSNADRFTW
jgi:hypothetical protein